jgi:hypothetical protein
MILPAKTANAITGTSTYELADWDFELLTTYVYPYTCTYRYH